MARVDDQSTPVHPHDYPVCAPLSPGLPMRTPRPLEYLLRQLMVINRAPKW